MNKFIDNKNAIIWCFDEAIGINTKFDGNIPLISIEQTKHIINHLISKNINDQYVTNDILQKYLNILEQTQTIQNHLTDINYNNDNNYCLLGWSHY